MVKEQLSVVFVGTSSDNSKTSGYSELHEVLAIRELLITSDSGQHGADGERQSRWSRMTDGSS